MGAYQTVDSTDKNDESNSQCQNQLIDSDNIEGVSGTHPELDNLYLMLDQQFHPIPPDTTCPQSVQIFEEHKQIAQEYLKVQTEMAYLSRHMEQLAEQLSQEEIIYDDGVEEDHEEIRKLKNEKENLTQMYQNLKKQLEIIHRRNSSHSNEKEPSS
jgi:mitogen-activated protein kinase kinase kinase 7